MADCYAIRVSESLFCFSDVPEQLRESLAQKVGHKLGQGTVVPLQVETPKSRHAEDLYQVLSDLTSMARMGVPVSGINTYLAAIRNAEQLLEKIDQESTEDANREKQTD